MDGNAEAGRTMSRLSRAEMQERNRDKVLAAARDEFSERGFREAKIDVIAERAELTRGAVYSNFPGKRALVAVSLLPYATRMSGLIYVAFAIALGAVFLYYAIRIYRDYSDRLAQTTFRYSILYLTLMFAALLLDHYFPY